MIAPCHAWPPNHDPPAWHAGFLELVPAIRRQARIRFRRLAGQDREDLFEEATANALVAYARLAELGKTDLAYASVLVRYAAAQIQDGRRVGSRWNSQEVLSPSVQRKRGFVVERLDHFDPVEGQWNEILVEDRRATPADIAACRIDFAVWLGRLSARRRRIALALAAGHSTGTVARRFRLSPGRISQLRQWLRASWEDFQGEARSAVPRRSRSSPRDGRHRPARPAPTSGSGTPVGPARRRARVR